MTRYFLRTIIPHLRRGGSLYLLTVFGVALGVASVTSIQIINRSAIGSFSASVRAVNGDADLSILGRTPTIPERLYPKVLGQSGWSVLWAVPA